MIDRVLKQDALMGSAAPGPTVIFVDDDNCPGPGSGTEGDPYCSIQTAIDNAVDGDEIVEIAGPAGLDLDGWTLVGYNRANGNSYKTVGLSGSIGNQQAGMGVVAIDFPGLQNGEADAIALVAPDGEVVEFISYEGTLRAQDGPAAGGVSTDIDVAESGTTPRGMSLQRGGRGCRTLDFAWLAPTAANLGGINIGKEFTGCP